MDVLDNFMGSDHAPIYIILKIKFWIKKIIIEYIINEMIFLL